MFFISFKSTFPRSFVSSKTVLFMGSFYIPLPRSWKIFEHSLNFFHNNLQYPLFLSFFILFLMLTKDSGQFIVRRSSCKKNQTNIISVSLWWNSSIPRDPTAMFFKVAMYFRPIYSKCLFQAHHIFGQG